MTNNNFNKNNKDIKMFSSINYGKITLVSFEL